MKNKHLTICLLGVLLLAGCTQKNIQADEPKKVWRYVNPNNMSCSADDTGRYGYCYRMIEICNEDMTHCERSYKVMNDYTYKYSKKERDAMKEIK